MSNQLPEHSSLPDSILELVEFTRLEEIVLLHLRQAMPYEIQVKTLIEDDQKFPLMLVRRTPDYGNWDGDDRFIDVGQVTINTYANGIEADNDARLMAEAARNILRHSVNKVVPELGHLTKAKMTSSPRRVTDWATATGPVQYADLPSGVIRYESIYDVALKMPAS